MKYLCLILIFSLSIFSLDAQTSVGLKFGYSNFKFHEKCKEKTCSKHTGIQGVNIGLIGRHQVSDKFNIKSELFYTTKGSNPGKSFLNNFENHLALPILLNYRLFKRLNIYAGPEMSYLLSLYGVDDFTFFKVNVKSPSIRRFDLGLSIGTSFQFAKKWELDLRFTEGLRSNSSAFRIINRGFYISLHRYFGKK